MINCVARPQFFSIQLGDIPIYTDLVLWWLQKYFDSFFPLDVRVILGQ